MPEHLILRVPAELGEQFVALLTGEAGGDIDLKRVSTWRCSGSPWTDVLVALSSAGSLAAIASVVKTWIERGRCKIEVQGPGSVQFRYEGQRELPADVSGALELVLRPASIQGILGDENLQELPAQESGQISA